MNNTEEGVENFKKILAEQAKFAVGLDSSGKTENQIYNSIDLLHAVNIYMHILLNVSIGYGIRQGYTRDKLLRLANDMGDSLKEHILLFTGIDLVSLLKRLLNKK